MVSQIRSVLVVMLLMASVAWNQERSFGIPRPAQQVSEATISAARLGVPLKARELYEKARKTFLKHADIEAQEKLHQALHLDAALHTNPGTLLLVAKAHALVGLDRYPEAIVELRDYLQRQPAGGGSQDAHDLLSRIQNATKQSIR